MCARVRERAALTRRPRCQQPLAWTWHTPLCPEEAPHPALGQASARSLTVVCWPMPWLRANRVHVCSAPSLAEASRLRRKGLAATRVCRGVCHRRVPFFPGARKGETLPVLQIQRNSAVGETVPSAAPGTRLRLRARCSGYCVGRRSPWEPATRKGSPGGGILHSTAFDCDGRKI